MKLIKMNWNRFALLLILIVPQLLQGQLLNDEKRTQLESYFNTLSDAQKDPGFVLGIVHDEKIIYKHVQGLASMQHQVPIKDESVFNIASVSKQFTALMVLKASLEGALNLDDDIREFYPDFYPNIKEEIKVLHLLNHTSGIRDYSDLMSLQFEAWWRREGLDNEDVIELLSSQQDLNFAPGTDYLYSNSNYTLLTGIIEKATGVPFVKYARKVFDELGMESTFFMDNYMKMIPNHAFPFADWGDGVWQVYPNMVDIHGDGFLYTTLHDQLLFEKHIQNTKDSSSFLFLSQFPIPGNNYTDYGFGLELTSRSGRKAVHHSGSTGAYHAQVIRFPEDKLSIFVMSNNSKLWSGYIADKTSEIIFGSSPKNNEKPTVDISKQINEKLSKEDIEGEYLTPENTIIRIKTIDGQLNWRLANNNPRNLIQEANNIYHFDYNDHVKIIFKEHEFEVYYPGSDKRVYTKMPKFEVTKSYMESFTGRYYNDEIDRWFELFLNDKEELMIKYQGLKKDRKVEIIQKDRFLFSDYQFTVERDPSGYPKALLISFSRIKDLKYKKEN